MFFWVEIKRQGGQSTNSKSRVHMSLKRLVGIYQQLIRMIHGHKITDNLMIIDLFPNASFHSIMIMSPCALAGEHINESILYL